MASVLPSEIKLAGTSRAHDVLSKSKIKTKLRRIYNIMSIRPGKPTGPQVPIATSRPNIQTILFVKNLSFKVTSEEMYDLFGRFGAIRQIRL